MMSQKKTKIYGGLAAAAMIMAISFNNCGSAMQFAGSTSTLSGKNKEAANNDEDINIALDRGVERPALTCEYPKYPKALPAAGSCGGSRITNVNGNVDEKPELYVFGVYNASNVTHGWPATDTEKLPLNRYSATMSVMVPAGTKPVILVLSAYEPTEWQIVGETSRVQKVILLGYHCQTATGVAASKVTTQTYEQNGISAYVSDNDAGIAQNIAAVGHKAAQKHGATLARGQHVYEGSCVSYAFSAAP